MADEDEIDILGDFSFNSCFALNNQGIPSCSDREDTVHPQWLLDSTATNWYDTQNRDNNRSKDAPSRKLSGNNKTNKYNHELHTVWSQEERTILKKEMAKYGRDVHKISQTLKTKTEAEIQALIEAEHGIQLDNSGPAIKHTEDHVPLQGVVSDGLVNMNDVLSIVTTGAPTIHVTKKPFKKKNHNKTTKKSLLKQKINTNLIINSSELYYEDDLIVGSTESVGSESDVTDDILKNSFKQQKEKVKVMRKNGNHRRKVSSNYDRSKIRNRSKDNLKSPQGKQRKDSNVSDDSVKSPKMQIVLGSGLALPVSEGEQIIKIEKKKDSECESDIEVDIDSDPEHSTPKTEKTTKKVDNIVNEAPIAVPLRKFEPMPKRNRKINLDGGGGYTIMHTESGDLYEIGQEPRKERPPKKTAVELIPCRFYNSEKPAPFAVTLSVSALVALDAHAHASRAEVMGLLGGARAGGELRLRLYRRVAAAAAATHCDMDPVSQAGAVAWLCARGARVAAWHHSHPRFPPAPSAQDLRSQRALQAACAPAAAAPGAAAPVVALVSSQAWPPGRRASLIRCFRTEDSNDESDLPIGYQLNMKLVPDVTAGSLAALLADLRGGDQDPDPFRVNMAEDVCPLAGLTYLDKLISSVRHHMRSAGYEDDDPIVEQLVQGIRDIFR